MHSNNNILKSQVEELKRQLEKKDAELNDLKEETSMTSTSTIEKNNDDNPATASIIIAKDHEIEKLQSELNQLASAVKELKTEASETKGIYILHNDGPIFRHIYYHYYFLYYNG